MTRGADMADPNSILGRAQLFGDRGTVQKVLWGQRRADVDLQLMNRWARAGFVSVPGALGPRDDDTGVDD